MRPAIQDRESHDEKIQVLVVDDHQETLDAIQALLEGPDRIVVTAISGAEALRCLLHGEFAVVLLDVKMADMDGYETAALIRAREKSRHLPIIFLTSSSREVEQVAKGYSQGAVDYIFKPCLPEILQSKVTVFVELAKKTAALARRNLELERARQESAERAEELARSNADLEQFAYAASHDLQEPLRMVSSYVKLLATRYKNRLDDEANDFIEFALRGVKRMEHLIQDVLAYARVGTKREFQSVDCETVLGNALVRIQSTINESGAVITHDPLPTVIGNDAELVRVFQNLLLNAIKFRRECSPIIHVGAQRILRHPPAGVPTDEPLLDQPVEDRMEWVISVQDNGIGIESQYWERIFLLFQRLHSVAEYDGSGIGLAICKKIVENHRGRMWVESQFGEGSIFYFSLPVSPSL